MAYQFDRDFISHATNELPPSDDTSNFAFNAAGDHDPNRGHQASQPSNLGAETWKYGEGEFDYLAGSPGYGYHGSNPTTSSHRKPWVHYFIIDNIKYVVLMVMFYFLFMNRLDHLGIDGVQLHTIKGEVFACYIGLVSLLFFKSVWRLYKMR